jgi:hypothetical protein
MVSIILITVQVFFLIMVFVNHIVLKTNLQEMLIIYVYLTVAQVFGEIIKQIDVLPHLMIVPKVNTQIIKLIYVSYQ